jgi:hypothetical protein
MLRWVNGAGPQPLGLLKGGTASYGSAISGDGSTLVGSGDSTVGGGAIIWSAALGLLDLNEYLPFLGADLTGWRLDVASAISDDGLTIAGWGLHNGVTEAWVATIPGPCYANCDGSTSAPVLNINDFVCFLNAYAGGESRANCDGSTTVPVLNVLDFVCFLNRFAAGCT